MRHSPSFWLLSLSVLGGMLASAAVADLHETGMGPTSSAYDCPAEEAIEQADGPDDWCPDTWDGYDYTYAGRQGRQPNGATAPAQEPAPIGRWNSWQKNKLSDAHGMKDEYGYDASPEGPAKASDETADQLEVAGEMDLPVRDDADSYDDRPGWQYGYHYGDAYAEEDEEPTGDKDVAPTYNRPEDGFVEPDSYDFEEDAWAAYKAEHADATETGQADHQEPSAPAGDSKEDYGYQYEYAYPEAPYGDAADMHGEEAEEADAGADKTPYSPEELAYPKSEYAYPDTVDSAEEIQVEDATSSQSWSGGGYGYEYAPWEGSYGERALPESTEAVVTDAWRTDPAAPEIPGPASTPDTEVEFPGRRPGDILTVSDQELLRALDRASGEPDGVRRAILNDYMEGLGVAGMHFGTQFEDAGGIEVLGLADDLPSAAALLAAFRMVEQGEAELSQCVDLLRGSLAGLPEKWIASVTEIATAQSSLTEDGPTFVEEEAAPTMAEANGWLRRQVLAVVLSVAASSLEEVGGTLLRLSDHLEGRK